MRLAPMPLNPRCRSRGYKESATGRATPNHCARELAEVDIP
jgi:hypothetical protein